MQIGSNYNKTENILKQSFFAHPWGILFAAVLFWGAVSCPERDGTIDDQEKQLQLVDVSKKPPRINERLTM